MFSGRLEALRERNKSLLDQLKLQSETLERLSGCSESRKREREDGAEPERRPPERMVTLNGEDRGSARAALARPSVRFAADVSKDQSGLLQSACTQPVTTTSRGKAAETSIPSDLIDGSSRRPQDHHRLSNVQSRVTFLPDECEDAPAPDSHRLQPLLGYDWIAGVLENDDSLMERPDDFFNDLRVFRSLNRDECVHSAQAEFSDENLSSSLPLTDKNPEANKDTHQCTFSYRINSRLFPVPLHTEECCPVCKKHKSSHPHTPAQPALIRVSIPRTTLLPPHRYKAHRRCSFDPSDSLGLPSHCLSGWSNTGQPTVPPPSSLDLQSSLMMNARESLNKELEDPSARRESRNRDQTADVSRLARYNFQHFSPARKLGSRSHPLC